MSQEKKSDSTPDTFDACVRTLLTHSIKICEKPKGLLGKDRSLAGNWTSKLQICYLSVENPDAFIPMFANFYCDNRDKIVQPIFKVQDSESGDTIIQDEWLKNEEDLPLPGQIVNHNKKSKVKSNTKSNNNSWSAKLSCKGLVIYYDRITPSLKAVSIPISAIYLTAIQIYKNEGDKSAEALAEPATVLLNFYKCMRHVVPITDDEGRQIIDLNINLLDKFCKELITDESGSQEGVGDALGGIGKLMGQILKSTGMNTSSIDTNNLGKSLSGMFGNEGTSNKIGAAIGKVMGAANECKPETGINGAIDNITSALQSNEVKDCLGDLFGSTMKSAEAANDLINTIPGTSVEGGPPSIETAPVAVVSTIEAADQD
jgi:hypothetical protein